MEYRQDIELNKLSRPKSRQQSQDTSTPTQITPYRSRTASYQTAYTARSAQAAKRRKERRRKENICKTLAALTTVLCLIIIFKTVGMFHRMTEPKPDSDKSVLSFNLAESKKNEINPPDIIEDFLNINEYSRPGTELKQIKNIFVHYTANPGTTAEQNRSYFANLAQTHERSASAHLIIGYDGILLQCIPFDEEAYAVKTRNNDSLSIECCYLNEDGSFTPETYETLVHTLAWLTDKYHLSTKDILRHYDCGGKLCPVYYVEYEDAWNQLLEDVEAYLAASRN